MGAAALVFPVDVRAAFAKHGGALGETNSVSFLFSRLGVVRYAASVASEDAMLETAIEADERNIAEMKRRLSVARVTLDRTSQYAIDTFNAQVEAQGELIDSFNRKVEEFNALNDRRKAIFASMHAYAQQHRR